MPKEYGCVVIGGGHAGIEAALAAARMGCRTLLVTMSVNTIGQMSCNPAIGGVGKGQLVKEIDALGGEMGLAADRTAIQFRRLNSSKGQAVRSSRCQSDKDRYRRYMQTVVRAQEGLDILEGKVSDVRVVSGRVKGILTEEGEEVSCAAVVIAAGTFLKGRIHIGPKIVAGGRIGESNVESLADCLRHLGFAIEYFKTGTPPRLDGRTIDFSRLEPQYSDEEPVPFSFRTKFIPVEQPLIPCHITHTNAQTHRVITDHMHLSPMYSGQIQATGVRYCPSIEDKLKKFGEKDRHQVFLEPQGIDTHVYYPNGISTGLPADVQETFVRTIKGLENVVILRPGYAIEHGVIDPMELRPSLESKRIEGLFFAGQINRTTGYEEAAAQGLVAGVNAVLRIRGEEALVLGRHEAYIGVLIDDLVTKGSQEPYRMFTSRVEYRLMVREDNADQRLLAHGRRLGLLTGEDEARVEEKYRKIQREIERLRMTKVRPDPRVNAFLAQKGTAPLRQPTLLSALLRRPQITYQDVRNLAAQKGFVSKDIWEQVEYRIKYEGFIERQKKEVQRFRNIEYIKIPGDICYDDIFGLSIEVRQKLSRAAPVTLGQASRISGVTPAAISILMVYLKKLKK